MTKQKICYTFTMLIVICVSGYGCTILKGGGRTDFVLSYTNQELSPNELWPDLKMKERFVEYWNCRFSGAAVDAFGYEAPYFQEMESFKKYQAYISKSRRGYEIALINIDFQSEKLINVYCKIKVMDDSGKYRFVSIKDQWVLAGKQWYHVLKDKLIFPSSI